MRLGQPDALLASESTLFLGAAFSEGAKNISGTELPAGDGLRLALAKLLDDEATEAELSELAEICRREEVDVYQLLYNLFTVKTPTTDQLSILSFPWRRIYTTNYDDCAECCRHLNRLPISSFSYSDAKPNKVADGAIIHLHGYIRATSREDANSQLVLDETSYAKQHFIQSPWYKEFDRDLTHSRAIFFLGYGLRDYKITSLLMQNRSAANRTFFVTRKKVDKPFASISEPYGSLMPIEISGFAQLCRTLPEPAEADPKLYQGTFKYLDPFLDKKTLSPPTPLEIRDLVIRGSFNYQRCLSTLPEPRYIIPRPELCQHAIVSISDSRCLLLHSRIGNGKTIFLYSLAYALSREKYNCYWCRGREFPGAKEIDRLANVDRAVLIIDSYDTAIEFLPELQSRLPNAKFIVSVRTGVQEVRLHEIQRNLPSPLTRISLNSLHEQDKSALIALLDTSGLRIDNLESEVLSSRDIRDVVLKLYNNQKIKEQLHRELSRPLERPGFRAVMVAIHLLRLFGLDIEAPFLRLVTKCDPFEELGRFQALSADMFSLSDESPKYHSPILSEFLMREFFSISDILDTANAMILETVVRRYEGRRERAILGAMMQYGNLKRALRGHEEFSADRIIRFYSQLHRDIHVNAHPLFWLQYAIALFDSENFPAAQDAIRTAYDRAEKDHGFQTFQIDTFSLKLDLTVERMRSGPLSEDRFSELMGSFQVVAQMIASDSNRYHAIEVMAEVQPFVAARIADLKSEQRRRLISEIDGVNDRLRVLPDQVKAEVASETIRQSLLRARDGLNGL
jgi:hypothetical protein